MQIIDAFRQRVASDPSKTLIVDGSTSYSAEMVEALSDQLARELQQLAGSSVGIIGYLGWTSADCLITILAALKAGQCLVALDPANPSASLQDVINHAGVAQIVTAPRHLNLANQVFSGKILTVDAWAGDSAVPPPFEPVNVDPTAPAIITYTSGSTGKPKGAINTRAGLENRWNRVFLAGALEASDIVPFVSPWRFPEQLAAMALGIRQECFDFRALGPLAYADWLRERRITSLTSYLGVFRQLASVEGASFPDLKK